VVFSGVEEACGDNGHRGDVTGGNPSVIGQVQTYIHERQYSATQGESDVET